MLLLLTVLPACSPGEPDGGTGPAPERSSAGWRTLSDAPNQRTEVAAAAVGDRIYVLGGFVPPGRTVSIVEIYDTTTDTWSRGPDLPLPVNHAMATAAGGALYVFGGYTGETGLSVPTDRAFVLRGDRWEELPRMPEVRAAAGAAAIGDRVYVAGGVGPQGLAESMLVYDNAAGTWSQATGVPTPREHLGVATDGRRLFAAGGRPPNTSRFEAFDPGTARWERLADMPTARGGLAATRTSNGLIVAAGGEADETFPEVEAFDVGEDRWVRLPGLPTPRHGLGVVAVGNTVYVLAGGPRPGFAFSGANEALDLS
ncbi:MAG TPA: kelch repeat-containing protein [Actinomycetota bacterium]|nr:kelch repeat-containing protein [Actinomycetota bacterium]